MRPARALDGPKPGAASASKLKLPNGPGSVRGLADAPTFDVFTAQVGYSIPLDLPKAALGFGPSLAVTYSGALGNGAIGMGFTLEPIELRRTLRHGVPTYTDADELELVGIEGGGRLVPDPSHAGQYWVEGQGSRLHAVRRQVGFEITDGAGTHYFLGSTLQSRIENGDDKVAAWLVESILDVGGQEIRFTYRRETGQVYFDTITWGPAFNHVPAFKAAFQYDTRPDVLISYATGFGVQTGSRLTEVEVWSFGEQIRSYLFVYKDQVGDHSYAISRLHSVEMHGRGGQDALPKVTFGYAGLDLHETEFLPGAGDWVVNQRGVSFADVDGDGAADLLRLEMGNYQWRKSRGTEFAGERPISGGGDFDLESATLIDLDGDARPEVVRIVNDTWRAYKFVGESLQSLGEWPGTLGIPINDVATALADVNGDGRIDVIQGRTGGISVNFNGPNGLGPTNALPRISPSDIQFEPGADGVHFVDMNGDGLADAVWMTDAWIKIYLGRGDGTFVPFDRVPYPWGTAALDPVAVQLADLNRDGITDLVRIVDGHAQWYPGLASLHFTAVPRQLSRPDGATSDAVVTITDANGNGSQDVVWSTPSGIWIQDLAGATSAGMLTTIDNGLGEVARISYTSSAVLAIDAGLRGEPWRQNLPVAVPVPTRTETDLGAGFPLRVVEHSVRDGFWDGAERRFGGFLQGLTRTLAADPSRTLEVETRFHQGVGDDRVLRGTVWYTRRSNAAGAVVDLEEKTFETRTVAGLPSNQPLARKVAMTSASTFYYEGAATPIEVRVNYAFDDQVRPNEEDHLGVVGVPGDEKTIQRLYESDDVTRVRDVVCEETVLETGPSGTAVVSHVRRFYTDGANTLPFGSVGKGWVASVQSELRAPNVAPRWITQTAFSYDPVGNPTSAYENGVTRDMTYEFQLFPLTEIVRGISPPLAWSATWDRPLGEISTLADPNADVTHVGYDKLARVSTLAINDASPHIHYTYDWSAPAPKTTTWVFDGDLTDLGTEGPTWPVGSHWRQTTGVANGAGEGLYSITPLGGRFIISAWKERDDRGQVVRIAEPFYSDLASPSTPLAGTRIQLVDYDAIGRVVLHTLPNGATKSVVYRPLGRTVTSSELGPVSYTLDGLLRIARTERDPGNGAAHESLDAQYDAADRIVAMRLEGGQVVHSFVYDTLGRLVHANDPDIGDRDLSYDDRNLLVQYTNGVGQSAFFDYDAAGRLTRRGETAMPAPETDFVYAYDDPSVALAGVPDCHVRSRLAAVTEPFGDVHFCYDMLGRQVGMGRSIATPDAPRTSGSQAQTLTLSGLLQSESFDDGFSTTYEYDGAGRATKVSSADGPLWVADQIDAANRVETERYGNGATQQYAFDALGLPQHIEVDRPNGLGPLYKVTVTRNSYGAPKIVADEDGQGLDQNATFSYDGAGRLAGSTLGSGTGKYAFSFKYDALQNMVFRGVTGPQDIGVLVGSYRYGERGYGPRQLTSVVAGGAP